MHTRLKPLRRLGPYCSQRDRKHSANDTFKQFDFIVKMSQRPWGAWRGDCLSPASQCGEDSPPQRFWMDWTQVNSDEWQEQLETIQAPANSKVAFACYSCAAAASHSLPLHRSLARSQSPTRFTLTPTTLSPSLCFSLFNFFFFSSLALSPSFSVSLLHLPNVF